MTEAEWAEVRAVLPVPCWLEGRGGQPEGYCHRQMIDAPCGLRFLLLEVWPEVGTLRQRA